MQTACPKVGGVRQDNVYDVDVKVVLLPNLLDVDIFMALSLDYSWDGHQRRPRVTTYCQFMSIHSLRWICIICLFGVFFFFPYFGMCMDVYHIFWDYFPYVFEHHVFHRGVQWYLGLVPGRPTTTSLPSCPSRAPSTACGTSPDTQRATCGENIGKQ